MNGAKCPWSPNASCNTELFSDPKGVFIIGSNDEDRKEYIEQIKEVIKEFGLKPSFAKDLNAYNGKQAFCSNICGQIRKARIIIADLSGPYKTICYECETKDYIPSVNVYWEYGYAAALEKDPILICDEEQILPFDIADKNVDDYNIKTLKDVLRPLIKQKLVEPIPKKIANNLIEGFKRETFEIPNDLDPIDERIPIMQKILKKLVYDYYYGGVFNNNFDRNISGRMLKVIRTLAKFDPSYLPRYTGDRGTSVDHRRIVSEFYHIDIGKFKEKIKQGTIKLDEINRNTKILSGDIAYEIKYINEHSSEYKNNIYNINYLVNDKYENNPFFIEQYNSDKFLEAFEILRDYGLIDISEREISISKDINWSIPDILRLDQYIRWKSINYLLFREET